MMYHTHPRTPEVRSSPFRQPAAIALVAALTLVGCAEATAPLLEPATIAASRKGGGGGGGGGRANHGATVAQGDMSLTPEDAPVIATTCPSNGFTKNSWAVVFGKSGCLVVSPLWASSAYEPYTLSDDLVINVQQEKKTGRITHVRLAGQDVDGEDGIWHNTDWIAVEQPVVPTSSGFTLHVHARNVEVWRYDSHLGGGNRVEMIGTISIGDIVYPAQ
jgi:hypothetical protein